MLSVTCGIHFVMVINHLLVHTHDIISGKSLKALAVNLIGSAAVIFTLKPLNQ